MKSYQFFKNSSYWKEWRKADPKGGLELEFIRNKIQKSKKSKIKILDIACGHGRVLKQLNEDFNNLKLYGIDINKNAIELSKKDIPDAELKIASVYKIPYPDKFFDAVIIVASFMHFENPKKALSEITRVCKNWIVFDVSTKRNMAEFLRGNGVIEKSKVPEVRYNLEQIKSILPNNFTWTISGYFLLSSKLMPSSVFKVYSEVDKAIPNYLKDKFGHSLLVYGKRKN